MVADVAFDNKDPSMVTSMTEISDRPTAASGSVILRSGSAEMGMAHAPGAIQCPLDNAVMGGRPRTLTLLSRGNASCGPTLIGKGTCVAGATNTVGATVMVVWAEAKSARLASTMAVASSTRATTRASGGMRPLRRANLTPVTTYIDLPSGARCQPAARRDCNRLPPTLPK